MVSKKMRGRIKYNVLSLPKYNAVDQLKVAFYSTDFINKDNSSLLYLANDFGCFLEHYKIHSASKVTPQIVQNYLRYNASSYTEMKLLQTARSLNDLALLCNEFHQNNFSFFILPENIPKSTSKINKVVKTLARGLWDRNYILFRSDSITTNSVYLYVAKGDTVRCCIRISDHSTKDITLKKLFNGHFYNIVVGINTSCKTPKEKDGFIYYSIKSIQPLIQHMNTIKSGINIDDFLQKISKNKRIYAYTENSVNLAKEQITSPSITIIKKNNHPSIRKNSDNLSIFTKLVIIIKNKFKKKRK